MKDARYYLEQSGIRWRIGKNKKVDLKELAKQFPDNQKFRKQLDKYWSDNILYNGTDFFKQYMSWTDDVEKYIETLATKDEEYSFLQESYLAYIPKKDIFVMGFDATLSYTEEYEDDDGEVQEEEIDSAQGVFVFFKVKGANADPLYVKKFFNMVYHGSGNEKPYKQVMRNNKGLLEIRLD